MSKEHFTDYLRDEFESRRKRNSRYSERAFAKALGLSAGFLSLLLQRKKRLSLERAKKIAMMIPWPSSKMYEFLELVKQQPLEKADPPDRIFSILFSTREKLFVGEGFIKQLDNEIKSSLMVTTKLSSVENAGRLSRKILTRYSYSTGQGYDLDLELRDAGGGTFFVYSNGRAVGRGFFVGKICHVDLDFLHPQLGPFLASVSYVFKVSRIEATGRNYSLNTTFQHTVKAVRTKKKGD